MRTPAQCNMPFLLNHLKHLCPSKFLHLLPIQQLAVPLSQAGVSTLQRPSDPTPFVPGFWEAIPALREGRRREGAHLNGLEALGACLALLGRQLISACRGRWQWLQKMVMLPGLGWPEADRETLPPSPLAVAEPADPAAPGLLLYPPGVQRPSHSRRELPLVTQLQTAQGYF